MGFNVISFSLIVLLCRTIRSNEIPTERLDIKPYSQLISTKIPLRIPSGRSSRYTISRQEAIAFAEPGADEVTAHTVPIYTTTGISPSAKYINLLIDPGDGVGVSNIQNVEDAAHLTPIKFGNQSFMALLDTGSADTWVAGSGLNCTTPTKMCKFGATYDQTESFVPVSELKMEVIYSTGEVLEGKMGRETITLGNIAVQNQTVGIIHTASWQGDGSSSGLIGIGFPGDTRALATSADPATADYIPYPPLMTTMLQQKSIKPYFSIALNRKEESSGVLALGGLPGPPIRYSDTFARSKFRYLTFEDGSPVKPTKEYNLYMIETDGFAVDSRNSKTVVDAIIDTGSPIVYVPRELAEDVNKRWKPPARLDQKTWQYVVNCDAIPPAFGVIINGTKLMVDPENMALKGGVAVLPVVEGEGKCLSGVQASGLLSLGIHILGAPFLKSVVAVFDVGAAEMRFAQRIR